MVVRNPSTHQEIQSELGSAIAQQDESKVFSLLTQIYDMLDFSGDQDDVYVVQRAYVDLCLKVLETPSLLRLKKEALGIVLCLGLSLHYFGTWLQPTKVKKDPLTEFCLDVVLNNQTKKETVEFAVAEIFSIVKQRGTYPYAMVRTFIAVYVMFKNQNPNARSDFPRTKMRGLEIELVVAAHASSSSTNPFLTQAALKLTRTPSLDTSVPKSQ
jgi:hypothetical protein